MQDLQYAFRMLRNAPGFALAAIVTLALGIGANTAIFSVLNAVVLRPLGYPQPERLMKISSQFPGFDTFWISAPEFLEFREWTKAFSAVGAYTTGESNLSAPDRPERVRTMTVSHDLFTTLGVGAQLGRTFDASEARPGGASVTVLSHALWQSAFGGDRGIIGNTVEIDGVRRTVIGVMPRAFDVADQRVQVWLPLAINPATANRGGHFLYLIGRLADGVTAGNAQAELENLLLRWQGWQRGQSATPSAANGFFHAPGPTGHRFRIDPLREQVVGTATTAVWVLQGAVVLVLLIACANLSTLLLSRAESRRKEFAVRSALGAGLGRLLRQSIVEGCLLSSIGAALGLGVAVAGVRALVTAFPDSLPRSGAISIDAWVLAFTLGVALATGVVFGAAPILHLLSESRSEALKEGGQRTTAGGRHLLRRGLVVCEVALSLALVVAAGLLLRTVGNLTRVDAGFDRSRLVTFGVSLPAARYATPVARRQFYGRLIEQLSATPGVLKVAAMTGLPPLRNVNANTTTIEGFESSASNPGATIDFYQQTTTDYVDTMGIGIVEGRAFQPTDEEATAALINETMAVKYWPGQSALGHRVRPCCNPTIPWFTIVGVLKDVKQGGVDKNTGTELYFHAARQAPGTMNVVLRTGLAPDALARTIQRVLTGLDPTLPIVRLRAMEEVFDETIGRPRLLAQLLTIFAALALLLSTIGTYAVLAYMVAERRREIGIRMALGATRSVVLRMVLRQGLALTVAGVVVGVGVALAAGRALTSLLFGVGSTDPATMAAVVGLIGAVALVACYLPGRAATRVDPMVALRGE